MHSTKTADLPDGSARFVVRNSKGSDWYQVVVRHSMETEPTFGSLTFRCNCMGFTYAKKCKHVDFVRQKHFNVEPRPPVLPEANEKLPKVKQGVTPLG